MGTTFLGSSVTDSVTGALKSLTGMEEEIESTYTAEGLKKGSQSIQKEGKLLFGAAADFSPLSRAVENVKIGASWTEVDGDRLKKCKLTRKVLDDDRMLLEVEVEEKANFDWLKTTLKSKTYFRMSSGAFVRSTSKSVGKVTVILDGKETPMKSFQMDSYVEEASSQ